MCISASKCSLLRWVSVRTAIPIFSSLHFSANIVSLCFPLAGQSPWMLAVSSANGRISSIVGPAVDPIPLVCGEVSAEACVQPGFSVVLGYCWSDASSLKNHFETHSWRRNNRLYLCSEAHQQTGVASIGFSGAQFLGHFSQLFCTHRCWSCRALSKVSREQCLLRDRSGSLIFCRPYHYTPTELRMGILALLSLIATSLLVTIGNVFVA